MKNIKNKIIIYNLFIIVGIICINLVSAGIYYNVSLKYDYGNISINSVNVIFSQYDLTPVPGNYNLDVKDNGNALNSYSFTVPNTIMYDSADENGNINGGGVIMLNQTDFSIFIPYESADEISVSDANKVVLGDKGISDYSKQVVSDEVTKEFSSNNTSENKILPIDNTTNYWIIGIVVVLIIIVLGFIFRKKR